MKKIFVSVAILAITAVAAFNVNFNCQEDSVATLGIANVEALANDESVAGKTCYKSITTKASSQVIYCGTCTWVPGTYSIGSGTGKC